MGPPIFKLFNVGCFAFALACLLFAQETTAKVEYAQHNADFLSSSSIVTLLMKKGSGNDGAASLVPPTATLTAQPSSSSSASSLNEQVQYGVLTKSFVDDQREKNSASCSMEMATCTYQPELSQLMDRAGQVNIITLRSVSDCT